jgi:chemosensory pili system protein ChpC
MSAVMENIKDVPSELRGLLIPITNGRLLMPNANVAEVITLSTPDRVPNAPDWLLGRVGWRGWRLPLISFSLLAGFALDERATGGRVCVMKALSGLPRLPYIAMLAQGFPRLTTVSSTAVVPNSGMSARPGVLMDVMLREDQAVIPDLKYVEEQVYEALNQAQTPA